MTEILMSTYNGEAYLREQLDSILAQTFSDWRLLVRDDGSTDSTPAILAEYAERFPDRIRIVSDGLHNLGAMRSFEKLLGGSTADYVFFADQDDVWLPEKMERMMAAIRKEEAALPENTPVIIHSDLLVVDAQLQPIAESFWRYSYLHPDLIDRHLHFLAIANTVTGCAMVMNKASRAVALPFSPDAFMHDASIAVSTKRAGGSIVPLHEALVRYRQHGHNTIGAVEYSFFNGGLKRKWLLAERSYKASRPQVFANRLSFWFWKGCYFVATRMSK